MAEVINEPSLKGLLQIMQKEGASDLFLKAGGCPGMRGPRIEPPITVTIS